MARLVWYWGAYLASAVILYVGVHVTGGMTPGEQERLPLGGYTWFALWCLLGCTIPLFVRLSRGYPRMFIVCSTAICVLAWLSMGMRYMHIDGIGFLDGTTIEWISDALNLVSLLVLSASAWHSPRNDDPR